MKRRSALSAALILGAALWLVGTAALGAQSTGSRGSFSCPDPSVTDVGSGAYRYYLVCTSDQAPNSFPIRGSDDLRHWHWIAYAFPAGRQPHWALPPASGHYWAPSLYRIGNRWTLYFAAALDPAKLDLPAFSGAPHLSGEMELGVATAHSLLGPWSIRLLHYRGQFDSADPQQEVTGGVIDPSVLRAPGGQLYLYWSVQQGTIWGARLYPDGLSLASLPTTLLQVRPGWECGYGVNHCVIEAPAGYYRRGEYFLFYSGANTFDGTYAEGVAGSRSPLSAFHRLSNRPLLSTGPGLLGPGGASAPVTGPTGQGFIFYHSLRAPDPLMTSAVRYLFRSPLIWAGRGGNTPELGGPPVAQVALGTPPGPG